MFVKRCWLLIVAVFLAQPLLGQDKPEEKKADAKDKMEKKEEKKAEPKDEKKAADKGNKYQLIRTVTGKYLKSDAEDLLIEIEVRVPSSRSGMRNQKITYSYASDTTVRTMKLPERLDESRKPIPYTQQERLKLKGDNPKLPGYGVELTALKTGQIIEVHLSTHKPVPGAARKKSDETESPIVTMIVIHEEAPKMIEKKK